MLQSHIRSFVSHALLLRPLLNGLLRVLDFILYLLEANFDAGQVPLLAPGIHPAGLRVEQASCTGLGV